MPKHRIRFVSAQPDQPHFLWQTHVYLHNFLSLGIPAPDCVALFGVDPDAGPSAGLRALRERFPEADIRTYPDTRDAAGRAYPPSIQPHLIERALADSPDWEAAPTFFQDCDIGFRRLPDFDLMLREHPRACLVSDTVDYVGFEHLHERCERIRTERPEVPADELIHRMCEIVGIEPERVRRNEARSGGAQYLLQGVGRDYWAKVYRDSVALRRLFDDYLGGLGLAKEPRDYVQVWTAGMWAYLWNLWLRGLETVVHPELDFVFAGAASKEPAPILHMAGLRDELKHSHFDKVDWAEASPIEVLAKQPYVFDHFPERTIAREYAAMIQRAAGVDPPGLKPLEAATRWRLLAWKTGAKKPIWDVERLRFVFEPEAPVVEPLSSGDAGAGYEAARAFEDGSDSFWGGRPERRPGCLPCLYLGAELDRPAVPTKLVLTQRDGPHVAHTCLLQYSHDGRAWTTVHVARLDPRTADQIILYRSEAGHAARGWRVVARETTRGFAWDVHRLAFLRGSQEEDGSVHSSGFAHPEDPPQYGPENAFEDAGTYWGGRPDARGRFHLGLEETRGVRVDRVMLEQGERHFARAVEIQVLDDDGRWIPFRRAENLGPGVNDLLLFEVEEPAGWEAPRVESVAGRRG